MKTKQNKNSRYANAGMYSKLRLAVNQALALLVNTLISWPFQFD